jgi:hypothetical protein
LKEWVELGALAHNKWIRIPQPLYQFETMDIDSNMRETRHHFCHICHRETDHLLEIHRDGTEILTCAICKTAKTIHKGYNYKRYERIHKQRGIHKPFA